MVAQKGLEKVKGSVETNLSNEKVVEISYLGRGACNNLYYCRTNLGEYSIKQERLDKLDEEKNNLELEYKILKIFNDRGLNFTPEVLYYDSKSKSICYKYIQGDLLNEAWPNLSEDQRKSVMTELGELHHKIHSSISIKEAQRLGLKVHDVSIKEELAQYKKIIKEKIVESDRLHELFKKTEEFLSSLSDSEPIQSIIHGDLHQGNILIKDRRLSGVVDFGDCVVGDIERDFSHYARHYPEYLDDLINSYEKSSGIKLKKEKILLYGLLTDIEKIVYHVNKYGSGVERLFQKLDMYSKILKDA